MTCPNLSLYTYCRTGFDGHLLSHESIRFVKPDTNKLWLTGLNLMQLMWSWCSKAHSSRPNKQTEIMSLKPQMLEWTNFIKQNQCIIKGTASVFLLCCYIRFSFMSRYRVGQKMTQLVFAGTSSNLHQICYFLANG